MSKATMNAGLDMAQGKYVFKKTKMPELFDDQALVKVMSSGICGSDLHNTIERKNKTHFTKAGNLPQEIPGGHEVSGIIEDLPKNYSGDLNIGDRVAIDMGGAGRACQDCYYCNFGYTRHCIKPAKDTGGGFGEYVTRKPFGMYRISDEMTYSQGALVEPLAISVHGLRYCKFETGMTVAVVGSASIGLGAIASAKFFGASKIIASAKYPHQAKAAKLMGADVVVSAEPGDLENACLENTNGIGVDIAIESVGGTNNASLVQSANIVRNVSNVLILGRFGEKIEMDFLQPMMKEINFINTTCYANINGISDFKLAIEILSSGDHPYKEIVTHRYEPKDIQLGFEKAYDKNSESLKVHINS
ncbi:MAG: hypothetical protein CL893_02040 [Dehalococcoidia bacterium]|nr:hypothetical protein [Dehalococcoidia bacterium]|tara:strand:- start:3091 stop:4170 length:1080 start_codon:yes stop_codon:yes gene_type:complete